MSWSSMNGINDNRMAGGMRGTRRAPLGGIPQGPTRQYGMPVSMPQTMSTMGAPGPTPAGNDQLSGGGGDQLNGGGGGLGGTKPNYGGPGMSAGKNIGSVANPAVGGYGGDAPNGVTVGNPGQPQLQQAPPPPQFDPRDPRNAALAGYMNGT